MVTIRKSNIYIPVLLIYSHFLFLGCEFSKKHNATFSYIIDSTASYKSPYKARFDTIYIHSHNIDSTWSEENTTKKYTDKNDIWYSNIAYLKTNLKNIPNNKFDSIIKAKFCDTINIKNELLIEHKLLKAIHLGITGKFNLSDSLFKALTIQAEQYFLPQYDLLLRIREKHAEMWRYDSNNTVEAMKILEILDTILEKIPSFTKFHRTQLYTQATTYRIMGKLDEALSKALILREKVVESKPMDSTFYFSVSKVLANIYTDMEDPKEANQYFQEHLEYNKRNKKIKVHDLINFAIQLSRNYEFDKASIYLDQVLPMLKTSEDSFYYNRTMAYHLMKMEKNVEAFPYLFRVRNYCKKKSDLQLCTICTQWLGEAYDLTGRPDSAIYYYVEVIKFICGRPPQQVTIAELTGKEDIELYFSMLIRAYIGKFLQRKDDQFLNKAISYTHLIENYFDEISLSYMGIDKLINFEMFHEAFGHGAYAHFLLWERTGDSSHLSATFNLLERCKYVDWDSKQTLPNSKLSSKELSKLREIQSLNRSISMEELAIQNQSNARNAKRLQVLNSKKVDLLKVIKDSIPNLQKFSSTFQVPVIQLKDILQKSDSTTILYFHWNQLNTYEYVISNRKVILKEYFNSLAIKDTIENYYTLSKKVFRRSDDENQRLLVLSKILYEKWLNIPQYSINPHIVIIPDGPINNASIGQISNFQKANTYTDFIYSFTLASTLKAKTEPIVNTLLAVAYGSSEESESFASLPGTIQEIDQLKNQWKGKIVILKGKDATKENFLKYAIEADGIYLATHSQSDANNRFKNRLILHGASGRNEFVTAAEIINSSMHPNLVILRSCESGLGTYYRGSCNMSLIKAFKTLNPECKVIGYYSKIQDIPNSKLIFQSMQNSKSAEVIYF